MNDGKKKLILLLIAGMAVIISLSLFFFYNLRNRYSTETALLSQDGSLGKKTDSELPKLPIYAGRPIGEVNEDKEVTGVYPESRKTDFKQELLGLASSLSKDSDTLDGWVRVGVIKKFFGDYEGARDAWEYAGVIRPQNAISFSNLGNLYAFYLKDYSRAEISFKTAIKNAPGDIFIYTALADLYRYSWIQKSGEVVNIINEGLVANPDNQTLLSYLGRYYKEKEDYVKALKYYEKILVLSPDNQAVTAEIEALKNKQH